MEHIYIHSSFMEHIYIHSSTVSAFKMAFKSICIKFVISVGVDFQRYCSSFTAEQQTNTFSLY